MAESTFGLSYIFEGWDGYHTSIVHAIQPLTQEQLSWRPRPNLRSVEELASHIAFGRIDWFSRMSAPGSHELLKKVEQLGSEKEITENKEEILHWLDISWLMIAGTLNQWTLQDLFRTYQHEYGGKTYTITYQWTIWRIMTHDVHHGGELALMLGLQGIEVHELGNLGGHLTRPPLAGES